MSGTALAPVVALACVVLTSPSVMHAIGAVLDVLAAVDWGQTLTLIVAVLLIVSAIVAAAVAAARGAERQS